MLRELLTMKNLLFAGVVAAMAFASVPAMAASDSFAPKAEKLTVKEFGTLNFGDPMPMPGPMPGPGSGGHRPMPGMGGGHGPMPMPMMGGGHGPRPHGGGVNMPRPNMGHNMGSGNHRWGNRTNGRWFAGFSAPGGWNGYRSPFRGYTLPSYWVNPTYSISNFGTYGLYAPMTGYGWSRYYDDAVLRDQRGYVQDYRTGIDWNRYEGGYAPDNGYRQPEYGPSISPDRQVYDVNGGYEADDSYESDVEYREGTGAPYAAPESQGGYYEQQRAPSYSAPARGYSTPYGYDRYERCLRERGVAGGAIGGIIGAVAGNRIAGRGDRLAGSLIGGGVGALAGLGIEKATNKCRRYLPRESSYPAPAPQYYPDRQPAPQSYPQPYPSQGYPQQSYPQPSYGNGGGYYQNGYYYPQQPAPSITTVTVSPATMTTTTTTTEEYYYETVPVRRKVLRKYRPRARAKPRCTCR
jgi:Ni/Co efflux regulator RcnB